MPVKKNSKYVVYLIVLLILQVLIMFINLAFAFWGEYSHGYASNIWAIIWNKGFMLLWILISNLVCLVSGIIGLITQKGNKAKCILSIVSIVMFMIGAFTVVLVIGSRF
ncbi:MAG: hypothetical protein J5476_01445 [Lachnospiraceae bacterium]|nr:hypothetical protein [Lachnospiraceae bacterium]